MSRRYAGMGWPNGKEDYNKIMSLPSDLLLMLATEGRYHYEKARKAGKTVIWRGLPRVGQRPAEIGWSKYNKNAKECTNLWSEQPHYGEEWFVPYNELDLNFERGDNENDFNNLEDRHYKIAKFLEGLLDELDQLLPPEVMILYPPYTPDHGDMIYVNVWKNIAKSYDGLVVHAYGTAEEVKTRLEWYLHEFPDQPIWVGEWNSPEPEAVLTVLKELQENYPNFRGATYFIWHWYGSPGYWPSQYNVDEQEELYNLFLNAPETENGESPTPVEPPAPPFNWPTENIRDWTQDEIVDRSNREADNLSIPRRVLLGLLITESKLQQRSTRFAYRNADGSFTNITDRANEAISRRDIDELRAVLSEVSDHGSTDVSFGLGQQTVRWADEGDHTQSAENVLALRNLYFDPEHAITVAGRKIASYWNRYKDDVEALSRYNKPQLTVEQNKVAADKYRKGLAQADDLLARMGGTVGTTFIDKRTGNIAGNFARTPKGFILHGSRSGVAGRPKSIENAGCANWCLINPYGLGWHASVGEGEVYVHMKASEWGWNARTASQHYIGVEFAQSTVNDPVTDAQVASFVDYVKTYVLPVYPSMPMNFVTHADVEASGETGKRDGKTDAFPFGSLEAAILKSRIQAKLKGAPPVESPYQFHFGFKAKADQLGAAVVGEPLENETYLSDNFSYQTTTKGVMFYTKTSNKVTFVGGE